MHSQNADQHISAWYHWIDKLALIGLLPLGGSGVQTAFSENGRTVYIAKNLYVMINVFSLHDNYVQTAGS